MVHTFYVPVTSLDGFHEMRTKDIDTEGIKNEDPYCVHECCKICLYTKGRIATSNSVS